ncbi:cell wall hydrolase [Crenalkalicoccus roseus]|uniref:cell wall hydrolase n=1 Tax=Crenalkalicoccus roseus TaxID=1485588 RepID=UPI0010820A85|nr:cell wall hydrolase [Crenalkalicoccus roseus]
MRRAAGAPAAETLALTLWAEAGTRPVRAIEALAALVVNRAKLAAEAAAARLRFAPPWRGAPASGAWPGLIGPVCRAPFLFACWNPRHPRHAALGTVPEGDAALAICRRVAARAVAGSLPDPTGGATHWHEAGSLPGWALTLAPTAEIGGLVFYRPEAPPRRGRARRAAPAPVPLAVL